MCSVDGLRFDALDVYKLQTPEHAPAFIYDNTVYQNARPYGKTEEYLALLPEAIPFLSELFEDPDEAVEGAARAFTGRLTELSGEDLKSLMLGDEK